MARFDEIEMTAAERVKLAGVEASADVTDVRDALKSTFPDGVQITRCGGVIQQITGYRDGRAVDLDPSAIDKAAVESALADRGYTLGDKVSVTAVAELPR